MHISQILLFTIPMASMALASPMIDATDSTPKIIARNSPSAIFRRDDCLHIKCSPSDNRGGSNPACESMGCGLCGRDRRCDSGGFGRKPKKSGHRRSVGIDATESTPKIIARDSPAVMFSRRDACMEIRCSPRDNSGGSNPACEPNGCGECGRDRKCDSGGFGKKGKKKSGHRRSVGIDATESTPIIIARNSPAAIFRRDDCLHIKCSPSDNRGGSNPACESMGCGLCGRDRRCDSGGFGKKGKKSSGHR